MSRPCPLTCQATCPARLPHRYGEWCEACRAEYDKWADEQAELYRLSLEAEAAADVPPATDTEWLRRLDETEPCVTDLAEWLRPEDAPCP